MTLGFEPPLKESTESDVLQKTDNNFFAAFWKKNLKSIPFQIERQFLACLLNIEFQSISNA